MHVVIFNYSNTENQEMVTRFVYKTIIIRKVQKHILNCNWHFPNVIRLFVLWIASSLIQTLIQCFPFLVCVCVYHSSYSHSFKHLFSFHIHRLCDNLCNFASICHEFRWNGSIKPSFWRWCVFNFFFLFLFTFLHSILVL